MAKKPMSKPMPPKSGSGSAPMPPKPHGGKKGKKGY
jgi:hypothetical protein